MEYQGCSQSEGEIIVLLGVSDRNDLVQGVFKGVQSGSDGRKDGIQFESLTGVVGSEGLPLVNTMAPPVFLEDTEDLGADGQWGLGQNGASKSNRV